MTLLILLIGLAIGSFLGSYTYRSPRGIKISQGRSFCPRCKKKIVWYDNIPLFSFLLLSGKCRLCQKKISSRYPLIELATALLFLFIYLAQPHILNNFPWLTSPHPLFITCYLLLIATLSLAIFVIDLEHQLILDETIFLGYLTTLFFLLYTSPNAFWQHLFAGFLAASSLLFLHLVTKGRGMGLGDVKFALFIGTFLGVPSTISWLFLAFILGALVGVILLGLGQKRLKDRIAFGPFLVLSFFLTLLFAANLNHLIIPFYIYK
jgi:leader peptidase (prepilin peptidase)/N-methyltransferase